MSPPVVRQTFAFRVAGTRRVGVIYVTVTGRDEAARARRAKSLARARAGDTKPELIGARP